MGFEKGLKHNCFALYHLSLKEPGAAEDKIEDSPRKEISRGSK